MPVVPCLFEIGKMDQRDRFAREKRGYIRGRGALRSTNCVDHSARRDCCDEQNQPKTLHEPASFNLQPSTFNLGFTLSDEIVDAPLSNAVDRHGYKLASSKCRRGRAFPE